MNNTLKLALAAAAVVVVVLAGITLLSRLPGVGQPQPTPEQSAGAFIEGPLAAGRYATVPFTGPGLCMEPPQSGCVESALDDRIRIAFTVPDGWSAIGDAGLALTVGGDAAPSGAGLILMRGGGLYSDGCHSTPPPDMPVGPTADDFAAALAAHPLLDVTTPVATRLGGYSGKYVDLQIPADITACTDHYWPWEPGLYAQGPSQRWHLWIIDVEGTRVVVQSMDYPGTPASVQAQLRAIVDSITIHP